MSWTQKEIDICKEALFLLRQDVDLPAPSTADSDTSLEWEKCKLAFPAAKKEVLSAHNWVFSRVESNKSDLTKWPDDVITCLTYVLTRRLAVPIAGRLADMQNFDVLYQDALMRSRLNDLTKEFSGSTDPVLDELVQNFVGDPSRLVNAYTVYTKRAATVKTESDAEVASVLGLTSIGTDSLAKQASTCLSVSKLSAACGLDANFKQLKIQEYQLKIQEWRKLKLNEELETNTEPVLAELLSNFKGDDAALVNAFAIYTNRASVIKAESEKEVKATLGVTTLDDLAQGAADALSVAKLATACGLDANVKQLKLQEYQLKIQEWRKNKLNAALATNDDPLLAELLSNFRSDDAALVNAFDIYTNRSEMVKGSAKIEVKNAHDWKDEDKEVDDEDHIAYPAYFALCVAKLAAACGIDANGLTLLNQRYEANLQRARIADLDAHFESDDQITKEVLAAIRGPFALDDTKLPRAMNTFFDRVEAVMLSAFNEIVDAHEWAWKKSWGTTPMSLANKIETMDGLSRAAFVALVTQKLAIPCGLSQEMVSAYEQQYQARLRAARVRDLETSEVTDAVCKDVLTLIRGAFSGEAELPRDIKSLTDKIEAMKALARKDVLCSHDWSFAHADDACNTCPTQFPDPIYPHHVQIPCDCLIISAVYGPNGKIGQWKLRGREIHSRKEVVRVSYVRDVTDLSEWTPKAYRAFVLHLAADLSKTIASSPKDRQYQEQLYRDALEDAKACDARESNTPDEAWGDNVIADHMLYGTDEDPLCRD